jgi:hypothetical protein
MFVLRFITVLTVLTLWSGATALAQDVTNPPKHTKAEISKMMDAASAGDSKAQAALGQAYADGDVVAQNFDLALKWYHKAADQGNAEAENEIGVMYRTGSGVDQSKEEAVAWYRKAASHGSGRGMYNLGAAYYNGDGVNVDNATAYAWFALGKDAGDKSATEAVARMEAELRPYTLNDGLKLVAEMYAVGGQVKQNDTESVRWYRKAAERGDMEAQVKLAAALMAGKGVSRDYVEARKWCESATKQQSAAAEACLGYLYRSGLGVDKNSKEATKYFTLAAGRNSTLAMTSLGEIYESGEAGKIDHVEAFLWYLKAAIVGDKAARGEAVKIKAAMTHDEWDKSQKRMREWRMDPQKVEAFLQAGNS